MIILVIRTLILYGTVIASMRIMGKRQIGELQPSELVVAIMISDLASVPMQAIDIPILSGIVPVLTLIVAEVMMSYLSVKNKTIRKFLTGEPSIVIYDGHINEHELKKLRFNINDLVEELRLNNCNDISDVNVAIIETTGKLSVITKDEARAVTVRDMQLDGVPHDGLCRLVISDGKINEIELKKSQKGYKWLKGELAKQGIDNIEDVFAASINAKGELFAQRKGEEDRS